MSVIDDENMLSSSLDNYLLNDDYNDNETSLLPNEVSSWLDDSLTQSNDQVGMTKKCYDKSATEKNHLSIRCFTLK